MRQALSRSLTSRTERKGQQFQCLLVLFRMAFVYLFLVTFLFEVVFERTMIYLVTSLISLQN